MNENKQKNIIRTQKNKDYSVIDNRSLSDIKLSWKARGILAFVLTRPDDWVFYVEELINWSEQDGEASFRAGWKELKDSGYIERIPIREGQRIVRWETIIHEIPISLHGDFLHIENLPGRKPTDKKTYSVGNQGLLSTDLLPSTDVNKKPSSPKSKKRTYSEEDEYYQMAKYFHSKIMETAEVNGKSHLVKNANMQTWSDDFRKMIELDKRDIKEIADVINWCTKDPFWSINILSVSKLREKYVSLALKMDSKPNRKTFSDNNADQIERMKQRALEAREREVREYEGIGHLNSSTRN